LASDIGFGLNIYFYKFSRFKYICQISHGYALDTHRCVAIKEIQIQSEYEALSEYERGRRNSLLHEFENEISILEHFKNVDGIILLID
jgi:hypothetical protein